jgi:hypothetical protein
MMENQEHAIEVGKGIHGHVRRYHGYKYMDPGNGKAAGLKQPY